MDKEKKIKESLKERAQEKETLFEMLFSNKSKRSVRQQFIKFKKAHNKALEAYKDVA